MDDGISSVEDPYFLFDHTIEDANYPPTLNPMSLASQSTGLSNWAGPISIISRLNYYYVVSPKLFGMRYLIDINSRGTFSWKTIVIFKCFLNISFSDYVCGNTKCNSQWEADPIRKLDEFSFRLGILMRDLRVTCVLVKNLNVIRNEIRHHWLDTWIDFGGTWMGRWAHRLILLCWPPLGFHS